jgi:DNA-binding NarL/FixJ family response regulator
MDCRVFLVEDLENLRGLISELFAALGGFRIVGTASTEAEARLWMEDHAGGWDLAIVDLVLDQGSGIGVLGHARKLPAKGRIVVFSSYASPGIVAHCIALGADAVFHKADPNGLIAWLRDLAAGTPPSPSHD